MLLCCSTGQTGASPGNYQNLFGSCLACPNHKGPLQDSLGVLLIVDLSTVVEYAS